jgi:hypothetical protein
MNMQVYASAINPVQASIDMNHVRNENVARITVDNQIEVDVHGCSDEMLAIAFESGFVEYVNAITGRDEGDPFVVTYVKLPGVRVAYYWNADDGIDDNEESVLENFCEMLRRQGVGSETTPENLKRITARTLPGERV